MEKKKTLKSREKNNILQSVYLDTIYIDNNARVIV